MYMSVFIFECMCVCVWLKYVVKCAQVIKNVQIIIGALNCVKRKENNEIFVIGKILKKFNVRKRKFKYTKITSF